MSWQFIFSSFVFDHLIYPIRITWDYNIDKEDLGKFVVDIKATELHSTVFWVWKRVLLKSQSPWILTPRALYIFSKIQLVVYYQCCILIGWVAKSASFENQNNGG